MNECERVCIDVTVQLNSFNKHYYESSTNKIDNESTEKEEVFVFISCLKDFVTSFDSLIRSFLSRRVNFNQLEGFKPYTHSFLRYSSAKCTLNVLFLFEFQRFEIFWRFDTHSSYVFEAYVLG